MSVTADAPREIRLDDYRPPAFRVVSIDLAFVLDPDATTVEATLRVEPAADDPGPLALDGDDLPLGAFLLDGEPLAANAYSHDGTGLVLHAPPARPFTLTTLTTIAPAANAALEGLYMSSGMFCTQCEAEGFRRITFFPDRPDVLATYRVTIDAERARYPVLLSNGNLVEETDLGDGRHRAVWEDPFPKPSYLFALVAGDLGHLEDRFTTASGREVALKIYTEHGNEPRCRYAMDSLKRAMRWDEERYGLEYDLDVFNIVAVGDFNMGAMENKSLNIFNSKLVLASPEAATDADYAFIESVIAHEYFHNWTGNRVTCRDWFQLSLKEGLTVYRDQEFSADMRSEPVKRIEDVRALRAAQFPEDAGPLAHPVRPESYIEINNFYTPTVYEKGAEVIRMMARLLGRDGFRRGLDLYFERHDGQAVTCDDFVAAMEDANGADLGRFRLWYGQAGTPEVAASGTWDEAAGTYDLTVTQRTPPTPGQRRKRPLAMPFAVALVGPDGTTLETRHDGRRAGEHVLMLTQDEETFRFEDVTTRPVPSLNRGFSAPVRVTTPPDDAGSALLMANDSDPFNRWEAGQQFATRLLLGMVEDLAEGRSPDPDHGFIDALDQILRDRDLDRAFVALAVTLPGEGYLADQMATVDVDGIHAAREVLRRAVAHRLEPTLAAAYAANRSNAPFTPDPAEAGQRALKNTALAYLAALDSEETRGLVEHQAMAADNMTDRMAGLSLIVETETPAREAALARFYDEFRDDPLVVDKWFAVQARAHRPDAVERVEALLAHEAFTLKNPNKVRALVGAFAAGNPTGFHRADGAGYRFLADRILELDGFNPQVAARLVDPLGRWRRFDHARQALMKTELRRVLDKPGLSGDVYEKASKSLDES